MPVWCLSSNPHLSGPHIIWILIYFLITFHPALLTPPQSTSLCLSLWSLLYGQALIPWLHYPLLLAFKCSMGKMKPILSCWIPPPSGFSTHFSGLAIPQVTRSQKTESCLELKSAKSHMSWKKIRSPRKEHSSADTLIRALWNPEQGTQLSRAWTPA